MASESFHEVAIPTMINIIDLTYRLTPFHTVITRLQDCWGHCCASGAQPADIKRNRCGHRINLAHDPVRSALVELLDTEAVYLNKIISGSSNVINNSSKLIKMD